MKNIKIILITACLIAIGLIFIRQQVIMKFCGTAQTDDNVKIQSTVPQPKNLPRTKSQRQAHSPIQHAKQYQAQSKQQNSKKYQQENSPST